MVTTMTDKELKRMGRKELIDIIWEMKKNEIDLRMRLDEAENKLANREIVISESGSIAEAALSLSGIFEAAQTAADDYLYSVEKARAESKKIVDYARLQRDEILTEARRQAREILDAALTKKRAELLPDDEDFTVPVIPDMKETETRRATAPVAKEQPQKQTVKVGKKNAYRGAKR